MHTQGVPIKKTIAYEKFIISVTVKDFFTKFTALTEENSRHIHSKFHHNMCHGLKNYNRLNRYSFLSEPVIKLQFWCKSSKKMHHMDVSMDYHV